MPESCVTSIRCLALASGTGVADRVYTSQRRGRRRLRCSTLSRVSNRGWLQVGVTIRAWRRPQVDTQPQTELARSVVSEIAPSELPLFEIMSRSFASDPKRVRIRRGGDEELGFGIRRKRDARHPSGACRNQRDRAVPGRGLRQGTVTCSRRRCRGADHQAVPKGVRHAAATDTKLQATAPLWSKLHKLPS